MSGRDLEVGQWVLAGIVVCGLSCRAPMHSFTEEGRQWYGCAAMCSRLQPVLAADVAWALLRTVAGLRSLNGLSDQERLRRLPELITCAKVGTHGEAVSVAWAKPAVYPRRQTAAPDPAVTRQWIPADAVLSHRAAIVVTEPNAPHPAHAVVPAQRRASLGVERRHRS